jgi:hypothetical protein
MEKSEKNKKIPKIFSKPRKLPVRQGKYKPFSSHGVPFSHGIPYDWLSKRLINKLIKLQNLGEAIFITADKATIL